MPIADCDSRTSSNRLGRPSSSGRPPKMDVDEVGDGAAVAMEVDEVTESDKIFDDLLDKAKDLETTNPEQAVQAYKSIINNVEVEDPTAKCREKAIYALAELFVTKGQARQISDLTAELRVLFTQIPKAKTAKIVRTLIDTLAKIPESSSVQIEMCRSCVEWCKGEKRTFLRQRVETRLSSLLLAEQKYQEALEMLSNLLSEVKKLDDKLLLVEIYSSSVARTTRCRTFPSPRRP